MQTGIAPNKTMVVDVAETANQAGAPAEVICGYTLQQRIGAGAFGEVWRAVSPGGLPKALKILHGSYDGATAETEMKSLQLMRELRHPFLLSVERIETSGDRMVIVTELADQNLEERFTELRKEGHKGIGRDELLKFLHDAADALDFMHEKHGLQHLDIKPSNLLLQGGHVKVADFGLIKNLNQTQMSMISGFTPAYAPPELFHGRPGRNSDQYSLAIVFQVMLTGVPPFAGRTIAQLTAQHLSSKPDLSALSPADQAIIARALSKNANARFPTCRELIDRLSQRSSTTSRMANPKLPGATKPAVVPGADAPLSPGTDVLIPKTESVPLPALDLEEAACEYRPTLFLGVGGLAGKVLTLLRRRLHERSESSDGLAAFPLLYVDSDAHAVDSIRGGAHGSVLHRDETLAIPLRDRSHYRGLSGGLLEWLSRRWLYNIPRSGQVEGLRPLGRLAFVDHQQEIRDRLQRMVTQAMSPDALQETGSALGVSLGSQRIDVCLIASTCGGSGSGSVLDMAYLARSVCENLQMELGDVRGILLHGTAQRDQSAELRTANTVSCLKELGYFASAEHGYPGDRACGLPAESHSPFDHTHFVQLGERLDEHELKLQCERIAEYLYRRTATPARAFFAKSESAEASGDRPSATALHVRTCGVLTMDEMAGEGDRARAVAICRAFLERCARSLQNPAASSTPSAGALHGMSLARDLHLDGESLVQSAGAVFQGELGGKVSRYFMQKMQQSGEGETFGSQCRQIDADFAATVTDQTPGGHPARILSAFRLHLAQAAENASARLSTGVLSSSSDPELGWGHACEALVAIVSQLSQAKSALIQRASAIANELAQLHTRQAEVARVSGDAAVVRPSAQGESDCTPLVQHAMLRFCGLVFDSLCEHARQVCDAMQETVLALRSEFDHLDEALGETQFESCAGRSGNFAEEPNDAARVSAEEIAGLQRSVCQSQAVQLADLMMQSVPREATARLLMKSALNPLVSLDSEEDTPHGARRRKSASPVLTDVGGARHVLAVLPSALAASDWKCQLEEEFGECVTVQQSALAEHFVSCEVQAIDLERVIGSFAGQGERICEIASRVHTRIDVDWNDFA